MANKPELGDEVCDLMIDSIKAKLSLIEEIDKNMKDSFSEEINEDENDDNGQDNNMKTGESNIQEKTEENNVDNE